MTSVQKEITKKRSRIYKCMVNEMKYKEEKSRKRYNIDTKSWSKEIRAQYKTFVECQEELRTLQTALTKFCAYSSEMKLISNVMGTVSLFSKVHEIFKTIETNNDLFRLLDTSTESLGKLEEIIQEFVSICNDQEHEIK